MIKKLAMILVLPVVALCQNFQERCIALSASDLTNLNKTEFAVSGDLGGVAEGKDLCASQLFVNVAGKFACRKPVTVKSAAVGADIVITDVPVPVVRHTLSCCTKRFEGCMMYRSGEGVVVDTVVLKAAGFIPDPNAGK